MALTVEQEKILIGLADREIALQKLRESASVAEAELSEVESRFFAEREDADRAHNDAISAINVKYAAERNTAISAVNDTKQAMESEEAKAIVLAAEEIAVK